MAHLALPASQKNQHALKIPSEYVRWVNTARFDADADCIADAAAAEDDDADADVTPNPSSESTWPDLMLMLIRSFQGGAPKESD